MAGGVMDVDHYAEAERLLTLAGSISPTDRDLAFEYIAAAQVHATLATAVDPTAGCGTEPLLTWDNLLVIASEVWSDGGAPPLPKLEAFATALGLVVVEEDARDADTDSS